MTNFIYEIPGVVTSLAYVWLASKGNKFAFIWGALAALWYLVFFFYHKLYADSALQLFFIGTSIYGFINWNVNKEYTFNPSVPEWKVILISLIVILSFGLLLGKILNTYTDTYYGYPDALLTSASLAASYLVANKRIENWIIWFVADIAYVILFIVKTLWLTAGLYFIFVIMAAYGYYSWKKLQTQTNNRNNYGETPIRRSA